MKNSFDAWLRQQVERLENEIRTHPVFESADTPTPEEMNELRRLAAIHRFLAAQMEKLQQHPRVTRPRNRRSREKLDIRQFVSA
ncbi:MAG: hypothetical protein WC538_18255 [Thermoanaerobaculia bacterium]|jgi:hypothetical protein